MTRSNHNASKTHCKHGHPFDAANTGSNGKRRWCITCERRRASERYRNRLPERAAVMSMSTAKLNAFWGRVDFPDPWDENQCWEWTGLTTRGYGQFNPHHTMVWAHRIAYQLLKGPIPHGYQIDHLCRVSRCVNPAHLEAVTPRENLLRSDTCVSAINARKTHCKRGHPFDAENTRRTPQGARVCRTCDRIRHEEAYRRKMDRRQT